MGRIVLVTGVSRYLGGCLARELSADPEVSRVIGVDVVPPPDDLGTAEFVRADIRSPVMTKVLAAAEIDTVVHMNVLSTPTVAGGRISMKEINVIGTMQLLAACQKSTSVKRLVVKSSAGVYGSSPHDPATFSEETEARELPRSGWAKDSVEVEGYVRGFSRRRPEVDVIMLRMANIIGPTLRTALTDQFSMPVIPTVLGYDPRLQFVHESDGIEAMRLATLGSATGVINVAGDGVVLLSQAVRLTGHASVALPPFVTGMLQHVIGRAGLADLSPDQLRFLSYGRVLATTRMREVLGFEPAFSTREAFVDFVRGRGLRGPLSPQVVHRAESLTRRALRGLG